MKTILISGGAGYIGSVIATMALQAGYDVKVIDPLWFRPDVPLVHLSNPRYQFFRGDVGDAKLLERVLPGVDMVIHTAAVVGEPASKKFPQLTEQVNRHAAKTLIDMSKKHGVKGFIFFSTCSNYGVAEGLATEQSPLKPLSLYAQTKVEIEEYLMAQGASLDWIVCRLSTVYGASYRMRFDLTVNDFTLHAYQDKFLEVFMPYTYRPYIHVFDVSKTVLAMIQNLDKVKRQVFNVGFEGENYQKIQIVDLVKKYIPELKVSVVEKGSDLRDYQVDFSKLYQYLQLTPTYRVEDGVREIVTMLAEGIMRNPQDPVYNNVNPHLELVA